MDKLTNETKATLLQLFSYIEQNRDGGGRGGNIGTFQRQYKVDEERMDRVIDNVKEYLLA